MRICYLDTSAALKLLIEEKESRPLSQWLNSAVTSGMVLCASFLLHTELHCAARRRRELDERTAAVLLSGVELIDVSREHLLSASSGSMGLRAADAIHLAVARAISADILLTYDREMRRAAQCCGLNVIAPS